MKKRKLTNRQKMLQRRILEISFLHRLSHLGSCLSTIDIIDAIYSVKKESEKFVLSNGHAGVALYVILEDKGLIKNLHTRQINVHPDRDPKLGIHVSTGSLGQGLPIALGMALANREKNVYCSISDGECAEGSIWEALKIAADLRVSNLKIVVNANGWGAYGSIELKNLKKRLSSFGHKLHIVDGHSKEKLVGKLKTKTNLFEIIFAQTTVEHLPFLSGQDAHYYVMTDTDYALIQETLK